MIFTQIHVFNLNLANSIRFSQANENLVPVLPGYGRTMYLKKQIRDRKETIMLTPPRMIANSKPKRNQATEPLL